MASRKSLTPEEHFATCQIYIHSIYLATGHVKGNIFYFSYFFPGRSVYRVINYWFSCLVSVTDRYAIFYLLSGAFFIKAIVLLMYIQQIFHCLLTLPFCFIKLGAWHFFPRALQLLIYQKMVYLLCTIFYGEPSYPLLDMRFFFGTCIDTQE